MTIKITIPSAAEKISDAEVTFAIFCEKVFIFLKLSDIIVVY